MKKDYAGLTFFRILYLRFMANATARIGSKSFYNLSDPFLEDVCNFCKRRKR